MFQSLDSILDRWAEILFQSLFSIFDSVFYLHATIFPQLIRRLSATRRKHLSQSLSLLKTYYRERNYQENRVWPVCRTR